MCPSVENRETSTYTLYFIRHGEATHNIKEKAAMKRAKEDAIAEGFAEDSDEVKYRMEEARKVILNDDTLFDCPLSEMGKAEAKGAFSKMEELQQNHPSPAEVLVSPLQRALQTADLVFPHHTNIRVREELQERQTGKACDTRQRSYLLARRNTFSRFSMLRLRMDSMENLPVVGPLLGGGGDEEKQQGGNNRDETLTETISERSQSSIVEEKHMLRGRTNKLFELLSESEHKAVAVVTHKGYLRELERGPFGQVDSKEFKNCEVRVYKATFINGHQTLGAIERLE